MNEGDSNGKQKTNVAYSNVDDGGRKPAANQPVGDVDGGVKSRTSIAGGGNESPVASGGGTFHEWDLDRVLSRFGKEIVFARSLDERYLSEKAAYDSFCYLHDLERCVQALGKLIPELSGLIQRDLWDDVSPSVDALTDAFKKVDLVCQSAANLCKSNSGILSRAIGEAGGIEQDDLNHALSRICQKRYEGQPRGYRVNVVFLFCFYDGYGYGVTVSLDIEKSLEFGLMLASNRFGFSKERQTQCTMSTRDLDMSCPVPLSKGSSLYYLGLAPGSVIEVHGMFDYPPEPVLAIMHEHHPMCKYVAWDLYLVNSVYRQTRKGCTDVYEYKLVERGNSLGVDQIEQICTFKFKEYSWERSMLVDEGEHSRKRCRR